MYVYVSTKFEILGPARTLWYLYEIPNFIPFIINTAGNLGPDALKFIEVLRHHRNQHIANSKFEKAFSTAIAISLSNGLADTNEAFFKTLEEKLECLEDTQNICVFV